LLDEEAPHFLTAGAGLVRDELHAEDLLGERSRVGRAAFGHLDAAAFASAAGVDLRFDDGDGRARLGLELLGGGLRLVDGERRDALGDGDAVAGEDLLALVLVDLHEGREAITLRG
jgi:hypothetical protein